MNAHMYMQSGHSTLSPMSNMALQHRIAELEQKVFEQEQELTIYRQRERVLLERETDLLHALQERIGLEKALKRSRAILRALIDYAPVLMYVRDTQGHFLLVNQKLATYLQQTPQQLIGKTDRELLSADIVETWYTQDKHIHATGKPAEFEEVLTFNGHVRTYLTIKFPLYNDHDKIYAIGSVSTDISERKHYVAELERNYQDATLVNAMNEFLQTCTTVEEIYQITQQSVTKMFETCSGSLYIFDESTALFHAVATWGATPPTETSLTREQCWALRRNRFHLLTADSIANKQPCEHIKVSRPCVSICVPLMAQNQTLGMLHIRNHTPILHDNDTYERWEWLSVMVGGHIAMALANIHLRNRLIEQSIRDPLTGLYNRRYMNETLDRELHKAHRHKHAVGIVMLDIDHFKMFNDTYGHDVGDEVLKQVATFLQSSIRSDDVVCRYGGEEFLFIMTDVPLHSVRRRAEEIRAGIQTLAVEYEGQALKTITVSLGVASFPEHGDTAECVISLADKALYRAKAQGRNCVVLAAQG